MASDPIAALSVSNESINKCLRFAAANMEFAPQSNLGRVLEEMSTARAVRQGCVDGLYSRYLPERTAAFIGKESAAFDAAMASFKATFDSYSTPEDFKAAWSSIEGAARAFVAATQKYMALEASTWFPALMAAMKEPEAKDALVAAIRAKEVDIAEAKRRAAERITDHRAAKKAAKAAERARLAEEEENGMGKGGKAKGPKQGKKAKAKKGGSEEADDDDAPVKVPISKGLASAASSPQPPIGVGSPLRKNRTVSVSSSDPSHLNI